VTGVQTCALPICWYSEAKALSSDFHVDHFRPKGRALQLDDTERTGYWWLAFDWRNYRLAGSYPNSAHKDDDGNVRGKQDYFPLRNLDNAATDPKASLEDEEPYFIDPTIEEDVILISFDETGSVRVNTTDDWEKSRVRVSVKYYYLDNPELKDARKQVWNQCKRTIQNCGTLLRYSNVDTDLAEVLRKEYQELRDLVCSCWELAGTARACVRQFIDTTEQTDENQALLSLLRKVLEFAAVSSPKSCPHTAGQQT